MPVVWNEETRKLNELEPFESNPRKISEKALQNLVEKIKTSGYHQRIRITHDNRVIGGHQRLKALKKCGFKEVRVLVPDSEMSDDEYKREVIQDNLQDGEWDIQILMDDWDIGDLNDWGLDTEALGMRLEKPADTGLTDPDEVPEIQAPVCMTGDVWLLGEHRLTCGDATDPAVLEILMAGEKADQLNTDPPYNVDYTGKTKDALKIKNDKKTDTDFRGFLRDSFKVAFDHLKPGGSFYIWHADSEGYNFRGAVHDIGQKVRQCLIWKKQTMVMGRQDYHWMHEPCLYGWKEGAGHLWAADRKQTTILEFDRQMQNKEHPTMKPVDLIEYQIKNNTKGSDLVLDIFGGSGSTMIACEKSGRRCNMVELDPVYCDVIIRRWQDFTGYKAVLAEAGGESLEETKDYDIVKDERGV